MSMSTSQNGDQCKSIENLCLEDGDVDVTEMLGQDKNVFDEVIGHIEDVLMDPKFQDLQKTFMEKHWREFEDSEENKLIYMDIFQEYTDVVEKYIEDHLKCAITNFSMENFTSQLLQRRQELDGEVFEILFTFTDFLVFKEMFLDYKAVKEGRVEDLGINIHVTSV